MPVALFFFFFFFHDGDAGVRDGKEGSDGDELVLVGEKRKTGVVRRERMREKR